MTNLLSVLLLKLFLLYFCDGWTYQNQDAWPGLCQTGQRQSPIALYHDCAIKYRFQPLKFSPSYYKEQKVVVENTETANKISFTLANGSEPLTVQGGNLGAVLIFDSVFFHWPAEHPIDGLRYSLDAMFDHYNAKYGSRQEANNHFDGVFTFVVNFNITKEDNPFYAPIADRVPEIRTPNASVKLNKPLRLYDLLPNNKKRYFRYKGSIPVPECAENIVYTIFDTPVNLSRAQLDKLTNITDANNVRIRRASRDLQDTNGREVYYTAV